MMRLVPIIRVGEGSPPLPLEDIMKTVDKIIDNIHRRNPKAHICLYELAPSLSQYEQSKCIIHLYKGGQKFEILTLIFVFKNK